MEEKDEGTSLFELNLDAANSYTLRSAASWAKVLGVVGTIVGVFFVVFFLVFLTKAGGRSQYGTREEGFEVLNESPEAIQITAWFFFLAGVIFIVGGIFSFLFGNRISIALRSNDPDSLERGFAALRNYFALRSIVMIIVLLLLLLMLAGSL